MHIRRGDFQYTQTRLSADQIVSNIEPLLDAVNRQNPFSTLYISTDEKDSTFFEPFYQKYGRDQVRFLHQYQSILDKFEVEGGYYGMIEQIVCSAGEVFIGTELSTFSAHITRLREHMHSEFVSGNKHVYFTTRKYSGDFSKDNFETESTWMDDGTPNWPHAVYFREFYRFLRR